MFEDIIGSRPKFNVAAELEKNGEMVPEAVIVMYKDKEILTGYITCPGMIVTDNDCFCLYLSKKDQDGESLKIYQHPVPIFVEDKEVNGKFLFMVASTKYKIRSGKVVSATP